MARGSHTAGVRKSEVLTSPAVASSPSPQYSAPLALSLNSRGRALSLTL